jgi:hypothetical protein
VSGDNDVVCGEIKTPISFVINRVSEENTSGGPGCQFVRGFGLEIGIAGATKHAQVPRLGGDTMEGNIGTSHADHLTEEAVQ